MIPFDRLNRRLHLYLGLALLPWLLVYGLSSALISHHSWLRSGKEPLWEPVFDRHYQRAIPEGADVRTVAQEVLRDVGLEGAFWAQRPNADELRIQRFSFWSATRITYSIRDQRLRAERQKQRWDQVIVRLHFRGGFQQPTFWDDVWAGLVDVACLGILLWVGTGFIMWWRLPGVRVGGALALVAGGLTFLTLVLLL